VWDLERLFSNVPADETRPLLVAVSGGGDSLALLCLTHAWALERGIEILSVTVDHGLRPEASQEAVFAASVARSLGIHHETIAWAEPKPSSGLAMAARQARYRLLSQYARHQGARVILVGHTAEDQAETILMRAFRDSKGSPGRGLAGMSECVKLNQDMLVCRPLIHTRREHLRAYLAGLNQSWIEDPTNADMAYERVRMRTRLQRNPDLHENLLSFGEVMRRFRGKLAKDVSVLGRSLVTFEEGPVACLELQRFNNAPGAVRFLLIQVLVAVLGGGDHLTSGHKLFPLLQATSKPCRLTAGRCVLDQDANAIRIWREARNVPSQDLPNQHTVRWDGRFELRNNTGFSLSAGPADDRVMEQLQEQQMVRPSRQSRHALSSTLCIFADGKMMALPFYKEMGAASGLQIRLMAPAIRDFLADCDAPLEALIGDFEAALRSL